MAHTVVSKAATSWDGGLVDGSGTTTLETSGAAALPVRWATRAEKLGATTNPEELIGAALATCYSMALSFALGNNGTPPPHIDTSAEVSFLAGTGITGIHLTTTAAVPGIDADDFARIAEETKTGCPVGAALSGTEITLSASLA